MVFSSLTPSLSLYYNGSLECTNSAPAGSVYKGSTSPISIGAQLNSSSAPLAGTYWSGAFGDVRTYGVVLTPSQAAGIHSAMSPQFP